MARPTFIEIIQSVLNDMSGDQVNSWTDTIESEQVGQIVYDTYNNMMANRDWPHTRRLANLTASGDASLPTHVTLPTNLKRLVSVSYNAAQAGETRRAYRPVRYAEPDDFLRLMNGRSTDADFVDTVIDPTGIELLIYNNSPPRFYTSFNDQTLIFDAYDSAVDSTIQESKIQALAFFIPEARKEDDFIFDLPEEAFPALIEEAKSRAQFKLNQFQDVKSEQEAMRQQNWLSRNAWKTNGGIKTDNYGRTSPKTHSYRRKGYW